LIYGDYPDLTGIQKILVIKLRHLGDVLLTSPVFNALQKHLPNASIDAYINLDSFPMLEGHPAISELIGYDRKWKKKNVLTRLLHEIKLLWKIRKKGYDLVINLTEGDRGVIAARISGAKIRVGLSPKGKWKRSFLTHIAKNCPSLRHTVEKNLDLLRRIGIFPLPPERNLTFILQKKDREIVEKVTLGKPFILLHPTSRWRFKCWPVAKMHALAKALTTSGHTLVLTASDDPVEKEMAEEIAKDLNVINLAGKVSLKELAALIEASRLLISVDSLPLHLASAFKRPLIVLFGPTSDVTWGPWRNPHAQVLASPFSCRPCYQDGCGGSKKSDCLESLPFTTVWSAVQNILSEPGPTFALQEFSPREV
jgi:heptosyltransferase-3